MTPPVPIHDYDGLIVLKGQDDLYAAFRARAEVVNVTRGSIDKLAGFCSDYASKVLAPTPIKRLSVESMFDLVAALGCDLALIENPELMKQIKGRERPRYASMAKHAGTVVIRLSNRHMRKIRVKGGTNSRKYLPKRVVKALARKAGKAGALKRWGRKDHSEQLQASSRSAGSRPLRKSYANTTSTKRRETLFSKLKERRNAEREAGRQRSQATPMLTDTEKSGLAGTTTRRTGSPGK